MGDDSVKANAISTQNSITIGRQVICFCDSWISFCKEEVIKPKVAHEHDAGVVKAMNDPDVFLARIPSARGFS
jgi:hypothetical protein